MKCEKQNIDLHNNNMLFILMEQLVRQAGEV